MEIALFLFCKLQKMTCYHLCYEDYHIERLGPTFSNIDSYPFILNYKQKFTDASSKDIYIYVVNELNYSLILCSREGESYIFSFEIADDMTQDALHSTAELLYMLVYSTYKESYILVDTLTLDQLTLKKEVFTKTYENRLHHSHVLEKQLLNAVQNGAVNQALDYLDELLREPLNASVSHSTERHYKNILISFVTLVTRSVIDGGLPSENAYILSDRLIQKIEKESQLDAKKSYRLAKEVILEFIQTLNKSKLNMNSRYVNQAKRYIARNIQTKIVISDIATLLEISPNYLSSLFKKETGETIGQYSQKEKIKEAIYLMEHSSIPVLEIATILSFTDQSHFIKTFKKVMGYTPMKLREPR